MTLLDWDCLEICGQSETIWLRWESQTDDQPPVLGHLLETIDIVHKTAMRGCDSDKLFPLAARSLRVYDRLCLESCADSQQDSIKQAFDLVK